MLTCCQSNIHRRYFILLARRPLGTGGIGWKQQAWKMDYKQIQPTRHACDASRVVPALNVW